MTPLNNTILILGKKLMNVKLLNFFHFNPKQWIVAEVVGQLKPNTTHLSNVNKQFLRFSNWNVSMAVNRKVKACVPSKAKLWSKVLIQASLILSCVK